MLHRPINAGAARIHLVEHGEGPLVLLVHGFPESWYSWRHQLPALADAGFRAVAIDVRGYGRSSSPPEVEAYGMLAHVADNVGVVRALGETTATVIGHDWGSPIAANSALLRPDVFTAVGLMSIPYGPRGPLRPSTAFAAAAGGDNEFYLNYFGHPGRAEAEIEVDVRSWITGFYLALPGDGPAEPRSAMFTIPPGGTMRERMPDGTTLPHWLSADDLDFYAGEFERTGMTGAINRYRNVDRDWVDLAAWDGAIITQPALFIGGELDVATAWLAHDIEAHRCTAPNLTSSHLLAGRGHWIQQEAPDEFNELLVGWLTSLPAAP